jgi:hypothetical protein
MIKELHSQNPDLTHIVVAVGSAGTVGTIIAHFTFSAGLIVGRELLKWKVQIIGIPVCDDAQYFEKSISTMIQEWNKLYHQNIEVEVRNFLSYHAEINVSTCRWLRWRRVFNNLRKRSKINERACRARRNFVRSSLIYKLLMLFAELYRKSICGYD